MSLDISYFTFIYNSHFVFNDIYKGNEFKGKEIYKLLEKAKKIIYNSNYFYEINNNIIRANDINIKINFTKLNNFIYNSNIYNGYIIKLIFNNSNIKYIHLYDRINNLIFTNSKLNRFYLLNLIENLYINNTKIYYKINLEYIGKDLYINKNNLIYISKIDKFNRFVRFKFYI